MRRSKDTLRAGWLAEVGVCTTIYREQRARRLDERGRRLADERRREWMQGTAVARDELGKPSDWPASTSQWHAARAKGKRSLFERVRDCELELRTVHMQCRDCGFKAQPVPVGCSSSYFCAQCRRALAHRFRVDFTRKRLGLTNTARRAGLMDRYRRRVLGGRFGERLLTVTVPHEGTPRERIETLRRVWPRFWRLLSEKLQTRLASLAAGIELDGVKLSLCDLVHYLRVFEWTPGADGAGHPHYHVWLFSPFIDQAELGLLWKRAFEEVTGRTLRAADGTELERGIVDVRAAWELERDGSSVESELVKYLTKEWEITDDGVRRASPATFAQVYAVCDGQRMRQSSSGLAAWAIPKACICPECGFESERGHWARIDVVKVLPHSYPHAHYPKQPEYRTTPVRVADGDARTDELEREYWQRRDREWLESIELRVLRARWSKILAALSGGKDGTKHEPG